MTHKLKFLTLVLGGFILVFHITDAQRDDAQLAQEAFEVFEAHCLECHGEYGSYKDKLFIDRQTMVVEKKVVIPGNPDGSELYQRLLGDTKNWPRMPLDRAPLPPDQINIIRRWIEARAPDWRDIPKPKRNFIPTEAVISAIEEHVRSLPEFDRPFACYFILTHLYNAGASDEELNAYRVALSKLINSLSWEGEVIVPRPIDTTKTIFRIDLRDYDWDETTWQKIWQTPQRPYPYGVQLASPTYAKLCQYTACELPFLRADWFIARASLPPLYHEILELPTTDRDLEEKLDIDVIRNLRDSPGRRVWRAGFNNSGVSRNNRVVERHRSPYGAYWRSYNFSANVEKQNIFQHPLDFEQAGGEIIFNLPNGLQAYYLVNAKGDRLDEAPIGIVFNREATNDPVVRNGLTCMSCHTEGIKAFKDQVRATVEGTVNPPYDRPRALRLYVPSEGMSQLVEKDKGRFADAVKATGGVVGGRDPIVRLVKQFEAPLDVAHAAAEAGVK
ncbi:hypothetical protein HYR99_13790, partial [Candidatus Poribacteria bacterium]|nr:hypothetical protein [Candidatus Poribacteria bacterium]